MLLKRNFFFLSICIAVLTAGFYNNYWNVAHGQWFDEFQHDSEALVVGRLIMADRAGMFTDGALTGWYITKQAHGTENCELEYEYEYQYEIFFEDLPVDRKKFCTYNSQIGGQALLFSALSQLLPIESSLALELFRFLTAIATALLLSLLLLWAYRNYGLSCAAISLLLIVLSPWLSVFGRNLWWSLWSFYLPFVFLLLLFDFEHHRKVLTITFARMVGIAFLLIFVKCFITGFEYITTALIMFVTPIVYYWYLDKWNFNFLCKRVLGAVLGAILAVFFSFTILAYQISCVKGSFAAGWNHIILSYFKRASGNPTQYAGIYRESLESSLPGVLSTYWNGTAFDLNIFFVNSSWESLWRVDFGELILVFLVFSFASLRVRNDLDALSCKRRKNIALVVTLWFSLLAPLSWFVIFKAHSYIHWHMNFIVWYMPFSIFGFIVIGIALSPFLTVTYSRIWSTANWCVIKRK